MEIVKLIFKIILTIIRIPFTIWYVVMGLPFKALFLISHFFSWLAQLVGVSESFLVMDKGLGMLLAIITFEWASLVKFYHFHW